MNLVKKHTLLELIRDKSERSMLMASLQEHRYLQDREPEEAYELARNFISEAIHGGAIAIKLDKKFWDAKGRYEAENLFSVVKDFGEGFLVIDDLRHEDIEKTDYSRLYMPNGVILPGRISPKQYQDLKRNNDIDLVISPFGSLEKRRSNMVRVDNLLDGYVETDLFYDDKGDEVVSEFVSRVKQWDKMNIDGLALPVSKSPLDDEVRTPLRYIANGYPIVIIGDKFEDDFHYTKLVLSTSHPDRVLVSPMELTPVMDADEIRSTAANMVEALDRIKRSGYKPSDRDLQNTQSWCERL